MDVTLAILIVNAEDRQAGQGKVVYTNLFIKTTFYAKYRTAVDTNLMLEGCERCIVA